MGTIKRLFSYTRRYWLLRLLTIICALGNNRIRLIPLLMAQKIIDECITPKHMGMLPKYAALMIGTTILAGMFAFAQSLLTNHVALRAIYDIRNRLFDHIQRLSFAYHDEAETGQLISRSTSDVDALRTFLGDGTILTLSGMLTFLFILPICIKIDWRLTLVSFWPIPVMAIVVHSFGRNIRPLYTATQDQFGKLTATIQQNLMGIRVVKAFAREDYEIEKLTKESNEFLNRRMETVRMSARYLPLINFVAALVGTSILWYGGREVIRHNITLGQFLQFNGYLGMLIWPVQMSGFIVDVIQSAVASGNRVFEILDTHPETHLKSGNIEMAECRGKVEFKNVSFGYHSGNVILRNINLDVQPGEMVALLGDTGSGKSTFINLLPRFYDVTEGALLIDGVDVRKYRLESLRRHIGIVSQETFLFGDTARGNIAYARPDAPLEEVIEAAKAANIHDFIESLPEGYDTKIGERGVNVSGGQKQRIAIARALLMNPPILILDDSTSSVDTETEALIQKALVSLTESRTTFVIAQRISTLKRADKVLVLDKGRIAELGTHDELLAKGGKYAEIYHLQLGGES